ncbi:MAG: hypothetical protein ACHQ50_07680 [Fimbriimonadales bacterium]
MANKSLWTGIVLAIAVATAAQGPGKPKIYHAKGNSAEVIGTLKWVITEGDSSRVIGKGEKKVLLKDVALLDYGDRHSATVDLSDHFALELPGFPPSSGFGMVVKRDDTATFCWEWFHVDKPGHATKLQETGELAFSVTKAGLIARTSFLTDVSIRVNPMSDAPGANPKWRVKILKGSTITWPSLVNGKVVSSAVKH